MITTLARAAVALIVGAAVALAGAGVADAAPASSTAARTSFTLTPTAISEFTWVAGQESWKQASYARLGRTVFVVGADGSFSMRQPDGFPTLTGRIDDDGAFEASWGSRTGYTGTQNAEVSGQMQVDGQAVTMRITYTSGMAMAAAVNGQQFGTNSSKAFRATLTLGVA
ncbi:hypothetical protein ACQEVB_01265 [Pseudonocardia sp. CA-107938]|uniref:hypothetical protein n=1 Tax=Pseudonocardia sp. CA-107938 TaxID=3240021 RepID=UPI003D928D5B